MVELGAGNGSGLPPSVEGTVITVGTFDGVHCGHQDVIRRLVLRARELALPSVLLSFEPHPLAVVRPESAPPLLTLPPEKLEALAPLGLDYVVFLPFTPLLASYQAEQFVDVVLLGRYRLRELLVGYDHGFGREREGSAEVLQRLALSRGFSVQVVRPVSTADESAVSSTKIRSAVSAGDLETAALALGRPYSVSGRVVHGDGRGRTLGYRTLNLEPPDRRKLLPPQGVYAVRVQTPDGIHDGMLNLGPRPTFGDTEVGIEVHLLDASGDWYGAWVKVDFVARLRDTRHFPDAEALRSQLDQDERDARRALTMTPVAGNLCSSAGYDPF